MFITCQWYVYIQICSSGTCIRFKFVCMSTILTVSRGKNVGKNVALTMRKCCTLSHRRVVFLPILATTLLFCMHFFSSWWYTNIPSLIKKIEVGQKISSRQNLDTQMHSTHGHSDPNTPTKLCYSGYKYYNNNVLYSTSTAIIWAFNAVQINKCNRTHISMLLKLA